MKRYRDALKRLAGNPTNDEIKKVTIWGRLAIKLSKKDLLKEMFKYDGEKYQKPENIIIYGKPVLKYFKKDLIAFMLYRAKEAQKKSISNVFLSVSSSELMIAEALLFPESLFKADKPTCDKPMTEAEEIEETKRRA